MADHGRLIDADALMQAMYHRAFETDGDTMWQSGCWVRYRAIEQTVKEQPTIEPERKKGKWIDDTFCSECGWTHEVESGFIGSVKQFSFCPNCGADMRGEQE